MARVPNRGRVREIPATEMRDAFRPRALLEREAAEPGLPFERRRVPSATAPT
jgi:DNA-binding GntR family transcriptional regulator